MLRIRSVKIWNHSFLGTISEGFDLVPESETHNNHLPYSTVIIGPNGTGKSSLLATIVEIFEDIKRRTTKPKSRSKIKYKYEISYEIDEIKYLVVKGRKLDEYIFIIDGDEIKDLKKIALPSKIIAVAYLAMDRFRAKKNDNGDFYVYLGLRDRSNAVRARTFINNTLPMLFDFIKEEESLAFLKAILRFLNMDENYLGISFDYRYKKQFFTGELTASQFESMFETYSSFSGRTDTPYGVTYFDANIRGNKKLINRLVNFINIRTAQDSVKVGKKTFFNLNLLDKQETLEDLEYVAYLRKLDLMSTASFMFKKGNGDPFEAGEASSGEFHFLTTMVAIQSSIEKNSLILIDEPETSFHPNWQMKYVHTLKQIFKKWSTSHFVMTTHSHFLVSDLEGSSSEIIGLNGVAGNLVSKPFKLSTYGWTADEILYRVFKVRTNRNHYFEYDITKLASLVEQRSEDVATLKGLIEKLSDYEFSANDPLTILIRQAKDLIGE